jgi:hypothetical protein
MLMRPLLALNTEGKVGYIRCFIPASYVTSQYYSINPVDVKEILPLQVGDIARRERVLLSSIF